MSNFVYKVIAQLAPSATTLTTLYTVPSSTSTIVSTITVCNQSASPSAFRISVRVGGAVDNPKQYMYYDLAITGNNTFVATLGVTLAATDIISVYAGNSSMSFIVFGVEIT